MSNIVPLVWMEQVLAPPSDVHSRNTTWDLNRRLTAFLDDTFRLRAPPNDPQGHWCAGTAPLLRAVSGTALWKSDESLLSSLHAFFSGLDCAEPSYHASWPSQQPQHPLHLPSTLHFFAHCYMWLLFHSPGLRHCFLERDGDGASKKRDVSII